MSGHCITADVFELRTCVLIGQHRPTCDGHARRREVVERYDRTTRATFRAHRTVILEEPCGGCLPRPAVPGGHLCEPHARRVVDAVNRLPVLAAHLWSIDGVAPAVDDGVRVATVGSTVPIPSSRILAGDLLDAAGVLLDATLSPETRGRSSLPRGWIMRPSVWASVDDVAMSAIEAQALLAAAGDMIWRRRTPARRAVEFVRIASTAFRVFPTEDHPHRIPVLRCRSCNRLSLEWHPPLYYLDDDSIRCGSCGALEDRSLYEHDVAVILAARTGRNTR